MDNYKEYLDPTDGYALVKQSVNMPVRPHWIDIPEGADCLMQWPTGHKVFYRDNFAKSWNSAYREWQFVSGDDGIDQSSTLWKRATQDPALISGAEAKLAWANGVDIQIKNVNCVNWYDLDESKYNLDIFDNVRVDFRLKPQTIKVELELPKPFEPKDGETYWHIYPSAEKGYHFVRSFEDDDVWCQFGAWRTEAEVKQVVEQLRKIRGTNS
ncbi:hypothetical protein [Acinetobacter baumannii]|uniref:hypothetical protein n=1 Tax=Acinetobacter baumannii TaxID=470 RepID=UPI0002CE6C13|nr:hypothetical protein [Acinetobacter baumannii]AJF82946.1 hypothetical protein ABA1_03068 [Acinetobacter baumannii]ELY0264781.1 hypothetical protein [Acinetobacter baumannii]ELY0615104.1 hypothetical protein [Acinetobacter baumannii]ELY0622564.1 hypothetical protein [Acinetobacter baumannii]ELY0670742.1 hypothetical protein [Acinetobacter baumannii]